MSSKNPGPTLYFSQFGGERPIPAEFIAAMNRREERTSVPGDVEPDPLSDEVVESKVETDRANERERTTVKKKPGNITLADIRTNDQGLPVQVTLTLFKTGTIPFQPSATQNVAVKDLGNGWSIQEVAVEGTYVNGNFIPGVFSGNVFERERPNLVPERFRPAIPTVSSRVDSAGTAVDPTLTGDELRERQEQVTQFKKRVEVVTQAQPTLPRVLDQGRDTNQVKQDVVVTDTLMLDTTFAEVSTAKKDVSVEQLGDGRKVQRTKVVPTVFAESEFEKERPDAVPEKFRVAVPTTETSSVVEGIATAPTLGVGDLRKSEKQVTIFAKLQRLLTRAGITLPVSLVGRATDPAGQVVTVTETLKTAGSDALPSATRKVEVQNLGDGTVVQKTEDVPLVFDPAEYSAQIPDVVPEKFRVAVPVTTTEHVSAGTAVAPALGAGDLSATQKQVSVFTKLIRLATRAGISLPISLTGKTTNPDKQVVTVIDTYRTAGSDTLPTALTDVDVQNLGDGRVIETTKARPSVLPHNVFTKELQDAVPPEFRTAVSNESTESESIGTATVPTLGANDLAASETQVDTFVKRVKRVFRIITFPRTLTDKILDGISAGGSLFNSYVAIVRTLNNVDQPIDQGYNIIASKVKDLGGIQVRDSAVIDNFPVLQDFVTDPNDNSIVNRTKSIVAAGTPHPGIAFTSQYAQDKHRTLRVTEALDAASLASYIHILPGSTNIDFPPELESITGRMETSGGAGSYSENGFYTLTGVGSGGISLRGTAQGSAAVIPDISYEIKQVWGSNVPCTHLLFFVPAGTTRSTILTKLTTYLGVSVLDWPRFVPKAVTITCRGEKVSGTTTVSAHAVDSVRTNYNGDVVWASNSRVNGSGNSFEIGVSIKVVRIPPTIHRSFSLSGELNNSPTFSTNAFISTGVNSASNAIAGLARGSTYPGAVTGSGGNQQFIPLNGLRLYRLITEPYKYNHVKVHAEVVDFANVN